MKTIKQEPFPHLTRLQVFLWGAEQSYPPSLDPVVPPRKS